MELLTAKIFVLHSGYASVADNNKNELIPYTLFGTLPSFCLDFLVLLYQDKSTKEK